MRPTAASSHAARAIPKKAVGYVSSAADCSKVTDGWYYDDPANPTIVKVCPSTCTVVQTAASPRVDIVFGCARQDAIPR